MPPINAQAIMLTIKFYYNEGMMFPLIQQKIMHSHMAIYRFYAYVSFILDFSLLTLNTPY